MNSDIELLNRAREKYASARTEQEMQVQMWAAKIKELPQSIKDKLGITDNCYSLRTLVPEMYEEFPNQQKYDEQYLSMCQLFERVNKYADEKNEEARECLSRFQALS